jgi:hypothetical protein
LILSQDQTRQKKVKRAGIALHRASPRVVGARRRSHTSVGKVRGIKNRAGRSRLSPGLSRCWVCGSRRETVSLSTSGSIPQRLMVGKSPFRYTSDGCISTFVGDGPGRRWGRIPRSPWLSSRRISFLDSSHSPLRRRRKRSLPTPRSIPCPSNAVKRRGHFVCPRGDTWATKAAGAAERQKTSGQARAAPLVWDVLVVWSAPPRKTWGID